MLLMETIKFDKNGNLVIENDAIGKIIVTAVQVRANKYLISQS